MVARKAVENELTKKDILEVARRLFQAKGYQQVSMREVAKELGYSHGSLYYHYKNKADLFGALIKQDFECLDQLVDKVIQQNFGSKMKQLQALCLTYIEFCLKHPKHFELMFLTYVSHTENASFQSYEKFSQAVQQLCPQNVTIQRTFSLFLSLQGFVMNYLSCEHEWQSMARQHVQFITQDLC